MGAATVGYGMQEAMPAIPPALSGQPNADNEGDENMLQSTKGDLPKKKRVRRIPPQKPPQGRDMKSKPLPGKPSKPSRGINDTQNATNPFNKTGKKRNPLAEMMGK